MQWILKEEEKLKKVGNVNVNDGFHCLGNIIQHKYKLLKNATRIKL